MRLIESIRAGRATLAIALLAPFLIGGNHCLFGAFDGDARMRCLEVLPLSAPAQDQGCCHGEDSDSDDAGASGASCCILVGPVPSDVTASAPAPAEAFDVPVERTVEEAVSRVHAWPTASVATPTEAPPGTPHSGRAPPFA